MLSTDALVCVHPGAPFYTLTIKSGTTLLKSIKKSEIKATPNKDPNAPPDPYVVVWVNPNTGEKKGKFTYPKVEIEFLDANGKSLWTQNSNFTK